MRSRSAVSGWRSAPSRTVTAESDEDGFGWTVLHLDDGRSILLGEAIPWVLVERVLQ